MYRMRIYIFGDAGIVVGWADGSSEAVPVAWHSSLEKGAKQWEHGGHSPFIAHMFTVHAGTAVVVDLVREDGVWKLPQKFRGRYAQV